MKRAIFIVLVLMLILCSCGKSEPVATASGEMLKLTADEIGQYDPTGREGYFVLNEDETFTPLATTMYGFDGKTEESSPSRYLWYSDSSFNTTDLIPHVTSDRKLVIFTNSSAVLPKTITLEKYAYKGATLGMHFYTDVAGNMYIISSDPLPGSDGARISSYSEETRYTVLSVNGSEQLPVDNIDNNLEMLLGLEEGKYYTFEFFKGTRFLTLEVKSDTKTYQSEDVILISNPFQVTRNGYFIVNLPDNLQEGFYYVESAGLFYYGEE